VGDQGRGRSGAAQADGIVSYFHASGIDRPLSIWKAGTTGVTHQSWRGQFARGTYGNGPRTGQLSDCDPAIGYPQQDCVPVQWPGYNTSAWHAGVAKPGTVGDGTYWMGSLAVGMRDATGQMYMRNRYYDPQTGQFTQPDPIGLAGGLNSYGFAAGDPVSYSDPYGLCPPIRDCLRKLRQSAFTVGDVLYAIYDPASISYSYMAVQDANRWQAALSRSRYTVGQQNAFRHVAGSCQLSRYTGEDLGQTAAALAFHEIHWHDQNEDEKADSRADMHNNEIGVRESHQPSNDGVSCDQIADRAIASGEANIAEPQQKVPRCLLRSVVCCMWRTRRPWSPRIALCGIASTPAGKGSRAGHKAVGA
jgi:RHS repeat-associated protein